MTRGADFRRVAHGIAAGNGVPSVHGPMRLVRQRRDVDPARAGGKAAATAQAGCLAAEHPADRSARPLQEVADGDLAHLRSCPC